MLLKQLNRDDAEKIFVSVQNTSGVTVSVGQFVCYDWQNNASVGVAATKPVTSNLGLFCGVNVGQGGHSGDYKDLGTDSFGLIQCWGIMNSVAYHVGAASLSAAGMYLVPTTAQWSGQTGALDVVAASALLYTRGAFLLTNDISGPGYAKAFVRAI